MEGHLVLPPTSELVSPLHHVPHVQQVGRGQRMVPTMECGCLKILKVQAGGEEIKVLLKATTSVLLLRRLRQIRFDERLRRPAWHTTTLPIPDPSLKSLSRFPH